jgi:hypothetical protein
MVVEDERIQRVPLSTESRKGKGWTQAGASERQKTFFFSLF